MTLDNETNRADRSYNKRHDRRNTQRIEAIASHCPAVETALDIGCNEGYISQMLLDRGLVSRVDAIELDHTIVSDRLKSDSRFSLSTMDVTECDFDKTYDCTVYGAVHHHVFGRHGYRAAFETWVRIVDHTDRLIFFETGQMSEGARWYWQRALRNYYGSDEGHLADMLLTVGPRLKSVRIAGMHWIHGTRRWLLRIELFPKIEMDTSEPRGRQEESPVRVEARWQRSIGSRKQELVRAGRERVEGVHEGVMYAEGTAGGHEGRRVFCKKHVSNAKMAYEVSIAGQVQSDYFITPLAYDESHGIVFPFIDMPKLEQLRRGEIRNPGVLRDHLLAVHEYADGHCVAVDILGGTNVRVSEVVDLNRANFFYDQDQERLLVCDMEVFSLDCRRRNGWNLAKTLLRVGPYDLCTLRLCVRGAVGYAVDLVGSCARDPVARILGRTPCIAASLYARLRELLDKVVAARAALKPRAR